MSFLGMHTMSMTCMLVFNCENIVKLASELIALELLFYKVSAKTAYKMLPRVQNKNKLQRIWVHIWIQIVVALQSAALNSFAGFQFLYQD